MGMFIYEHESQSKQGGHSSLKWSSVKEDLVEAYCVLFYLHLFKSTSRLVPAGDLLDGKKQKSTLKIYIFIDSFFRKRGREREWEI